MHEDKWERVKALLFLMDKGDPLWKGEVEKFCKDFPEDRSAVDLVVSLVTGKDNMDRVKWGKRLLTTSRDPIFRYLAHHYLVAPYLHLGDGVAAERHAHLAMETGLNPNKSAIIFGGLALFAGHPDKARSILEEGNSSLAGHLYLSGILCFLYGDFVEAKALLIKSKEKEMPAEAIDEVLGFVLMCSGKLGEARVALTKSMGIFVEKGWGYSIYPALKLAFVDYLQGKPVSVSTEVLDLADSKDPELKTAFTELEALRLAGGDSLEEAARLELEAAGRYFSVAQPLEGAHASAWASFWAWEARSPLFFQIADELLASIRVFPFIKKHFALAEFVERVILPARVTEEAEVEVNMFGGLQANGLPDPAHWTSRKALSIFKYLLLNEGKGVMGDYIAYLVWPRSSERKVRTRLRSELHRLRLELGPLKGLLERRGEAYLIRKSPRLKVDVWEFLDRLEGGGATEDYLMALELYRGKLLPEDRYDRFIEEHRDYLHAKFQRALEKATQLLVKSGRGGEALDLAEKFYLIFPRDDPVARIYIGLLKDLRRHAEAEKAYDEFRRRLWREHRMRPSFRI